MSEGQGEYILNTRVPVESVEEKFETENEGQIKYRLCSDTRLTRKKHGSVSVK